MNVFAKQKAAERLSDRLSSLESTVRQLQTANKHLELEWEELYDKVRRQMSRMSKRYAVDAREKDEPSEPESTAGAGDRMDSISAKILARRASNGAQP